MYQTIIIEQTTGMLTPTELRGYIDSSFDPILNQFPNHPDVLILKPQKTKYTVEEMQVAVDWDKLRPHSAAQKLLIISYADNLTVDCQNKLLKLIEEPASATQI